MKNIYGHKTIHILIALAIFIVGAFFGISSLKADSLPFGSTLTGMFPDIDQNYASIHFNYGGNDFAGMVFMTAPTTLSSPENIIITGGGGQSINCYQKINGIYYSNMRGWKVWPLDTGNLATLITADPEYNALQVAGGLYSNCTGATFSPASNEVFGQITHTRSGTIYTITAGLQYNTTTNHISGTSFGHTLFIVSSTLTGRLYDSYGGIGDVGGTGQGNIDFSGTGLCSTFSVSPTIFTAGSPTTFTCYGNDDGSNIISGYTLTILSGLTTYYTNLINTGTVSSTWTTGSGLPQGTYTAFCIVHGIGIGYDGQCGPTYTLTVTGAQTSSGSSSCGLGGDLTLTTVAGSIAQTDNPNYYYVNTTGNINFGIRANQPAYYIISSSGITNTVTGLYNGSYLPPYYTQTNTGTINFSSANGRQTITTIFSTGSCTWQAPSKWITVDLLPPTTPTITTPNNGSGVCYVGNFNLGWNAAYDSGVGVSSYYYKIANNSGFTSPIISASTTGTTVTLDANQFGTGYFSGSYYRSVQAIDGLGQTSNTATGYFYIGYEYCTSNNIIIAGTIPRLRNAELNTSYLSDPFTVYNLPGPMLAYVESGILIIEGTGTSNTGIIHNDDELNIRYTSSNQYNTTVSTIFHVGPKHATFYITTKSLTGQSNSGSSLSGCNLSNTQENMIENVFDSIKDAYDEDTDTLESFVFTMQSMLEDEVDLTENCALDYLLNLVDSYIMDNAGGGSDIDTSDHEAPNCKVYTIQYDEDKYGYTSSNLRKKTYFATREALIRYIDTYNPGDCNTNSYEDLPDFANDDEFSQIEGSGYHIAPNGKMYAIKDKTLSGTTIYYSPDLIKAKNFENQEDLYTYIDINNPIMDIRNHEVDTDFDPITHVAPNRKEYKIYKTDQGFMSYKLMKVQYFNTLDELKSYINKNNR